MYKPNRMVNDAQSQAFRLRRAIGASAEQNQTILHCDGKVGLRGRLRPRTAAVRPRTEAWQRGCLPSANLKVSPERMRWATMPEYFSAGCSENIAVKPGILVANASCPVNTNGDV
jgi:hypothetical protein